MKRSEFNQGVTFKVFLHGHERADGTNTVYLRVIIDRRKREFNLKTTWPKVFFDDERQEAKPRHVRDKEAEQVNMIINEAKGRAARIKLRYFSDSRVLSLDAFQKEFENYESRDNFLFYWREKQANLLGKSIISKDTAIRHKLNFNRFTEFLGTIQFLSMAELTRDNMLQYQTWLRKKKKLMYNTSVNALKTLHTYINHAIEDGYKIEDPFKNIPLSYKPGERQALDRDELAALRKQLKSSKITDIHREVLRKFLFSCYTGLRISDSAQITRQMISNGQLKVSLVKGRTFGKVVQIPLPDYAKELITGRAGVLFKKISDQKCNIWLKVIAEKANIEKRLTFHVSRDTFATIFIEMGGDVFTLKDILGHGSVKTTEIYVKMSENRKKQLMGNFNKL